MNEQLQEWMNGAKRCVFFGGAGISTESGIPDFRSVDGLYNQSYRFAPETILSHTFFRQNTEEFYRFYKDKMLMLQAQPNPAHLTLARWEQEGRLTAVVTQNIDGLHQKAGSQQVFELHGSVHRNFCMVCAKLYPVQAVQIAKGVPCCACGGVIKPDVVLYEEALNAQVMNDVIKVVSEADVLIVGGDFFDGVSGNRAD